jgi:hypothetical protein
MHYSGLSISLVRTHTEIERKSNVNSIKHSTVMAESISLLYIIILRFFSAVPSAGTRMAVTTSKDHVDLLTFNWPSQTGQTGPNK